MFCRYQRADHSMDLLLLNRANHTRENDRIVPFPFRFLEHVPGLMARLTSLNAAPLRGLTMQLCRTAVPNSL